MADSAFAVKVDGKLYTVDRFTLGDWRLLKTEFGLKGSDILTELPPDKDGNVAQVLNVDDPNVLIGLLVVALHHERPLAPVSALVTEVEALGMDGFEFPDNSEDDEADPTPADDDAATESPSSDGKSAKTRKKPGTPR